MAGTVLILSVPLVLDQLDTTYHRDSQSTLELRMLVEIVEPWTPAQATERIRSIASGRYDLWLTNHAKEQMEERDLIVGDVSYLLRNGFVYDEPKPATRVGYYRYQMESKTPNSGPRDIKVIVIPDWTRKALKIPTVMWKDEPLVSA